jgi:hypothetical protein
MFASWEGSRTLGGEFAESSLEQNAPVRIILPNGHPDLADARRL